MKVSPEEQTGQFEPQKKTIGKAKDKSTESMRSEYQRETESGQINRASETRGTPIIEYLPLPDFTKYNII